MKKKFNISASILGANFAKLGEELLALEKAGVGSIHFDVMDGSFVPNITFGALVIRSLRKLTKLPFETHLMVNNAARHIKDYVDAGSDTIIVHTETETHLDRTVDLIHSFGIKAGVTLVPTTHENALDYLYDKVDSIMVMTVNPGFGGQKLIPSQLTKIKNIRKKINSAKRKITLIADGGINDKTARQALKAGADTLVVGGYIFQGKNYAKALSLIG